MEPALEIGIVELRTLGKTPAREERHRLPESGGHGTEKAPRRAAFAAVKDGKLAVALQRLKAPLRGKDVLAVALGGRKTRIVSREKIRDKQTVLMRL